MPTIEKGIHIRVFLYRYVYLNVKVASQSNSPPTQPGPTIACTVIFILKLDFVEWQKTSKQLFEREYISGYYYSYYFYHICNVLLIYVISIRT